MIKLNNISIKYGDLQVLENFDMTFDENRITCLLGPSGVGKTTIANTIAKLISPDSGYITGIENAIYSYVFQEPRLLDWYSAYDNIDFVLKDIYDVHERKKIIETYMDMMGLTDYKNYKPKDLSGGMTQRVSITRAFAYPSNIMIMDEPFKGLDIKLKYEILSSFQRLWSKSKRTVIFITHDIDEAVLLSHTIYVIKNRPAKVISKLENALDKVSTKEKIKSLLL